MSYRGRPFKIYDTGELASTFSFADESSVRDRWWNINAADVVFDIGAGFGSYALPALACGAVVYAFGPPIHDFMAMQASVSLNTFRDRCLMIPIGCASFAGWLHPETLQVSSEPFEGAMYVAPLDDSMSARLTGAVTWIKIDVEGAELDVLVGATQLIKKFRPKILIENHVFKIPDINVQCQRYLEGLGYRLEGEVPYHAVSHSLYLP